MQRPLPLPNCPARRAESGTGSFTQACVAGCARWWGARRRRGPCARCGCSARPLAPALPAEDHAVAPALCGPALVLAPRPVLLALGPGGGPTRADREVSGRGGR